MRTNTSLALALASLSLAMLGATADARHGGHHGQKHGARLLAKTADTDASGDVSAEEWQAFLDGLVVDEDGAVDLTALAEQLPAPPTTRHQRHRARERDVEPPTAEEILGRVLDHDGDGTVTVTDLEAIFDELDSDGDGALTETDRPERTTRTRMNRRARKAGRFVLHVADADASGDVTADEWQTFKDGLDADENGVFEAQTLLALLPEPEEGTRLADKTDEERAAKLARVIDRDRDELLELDDLDAIFDKLDRDDDGALSSDELAKQRAV
jgi:Ca2+-binding EF-hand superfamily protein